MQREGEHQRCTAVHLLQPAPSSPAPAAAHCKAAFRHSTTRAVHSHAIGQYGNAKRREGALTSAMRAERLGSYSSRCTTAAAVPSGRAKSIWRYTCSWVRHEAHREAVGRAAPRQQGAVQDGTTQCPLSQQSAGPGWRPVAPNLALQPLHLLSSQRLPPRTLRWPPPRWRTVITPCALRPPLRDSPSVSGLKGPPFHRPLRDVTMRPRKPAAVVRHRHRT